MNITRMTLLTLTLIVIFLTSACAPHPGAGKWKALDENELGIKSLSILFDGKAEFRSTAKDIAVWHCFWGAEDKISMSITCVPSSDTERREKFEFKVDAQGLGSLSRLGKLVSNFERQPYE